MPHSLAFRWISLFALLLVSGCTATPPKNINNSCAIFEEKSGWYKITKRVREKYGVPQHVVLAIMHQESSFRAEAKTPRRKLLGFIPWFRVSSAYGYAQVKDETWDWYRTKSGKWMADRDDFEDAAEFIGWYANLASRNLGISKWDAYNQYLAYHEGHGGWKRKTYLRKPWLVKVARKVKARSLRYAEQLNGCRDDLESPWWWPF